MDQFFTESWNIRNAKLRAFLIRGLVYANTGYLNDTTIIKPNEIHHVVDFLCQWRADNLLTAQHSYCERVLFHWGVCGVHHPEGKPLGHFAIVQSHRYPVLRFRSFSPFSDKEVKPRAMR